MKKLIFIFALITVVLSINAQSVVVGTENDTIFAQANETFETVKMTARYDASLQINYTVVTDSAVLQIIRMKSIDGDNYTPVDTSTVSVAASGGLYMDSDVGGELFQALKVSNTAVGDTVLITVLQERKKL